LQCFEDGNALTDQILGRFLRSTDLLSAPNPSGQNASPQQDSSHRFFVESVKQWPLAYALPKFTHGFASCFVIALIFELRGELAAQLCALI
jgi:hypothetical protein